MAKVVGLIGSGHGKLGNTVFAVRRGVQIARVYQPVVANPKSTRQQLSRAKMRLAVQSLRPMKRFINAGWQNVAPGYQFQQAVAMAIPVKNGIITGSTDVTIGFDEETCILALSKGTLSKPIVGTLDLEDEATVKFTATPSENDHYTTGGASIALGLVVCVYNPAAEDSVVAYVTENQQGVFNAEVKVPTNWSGMQVNVYCFTKQLPEAVNGILTNNTPWRFPSEVSPTAFVGTGSIA